MFSGSDLPSAAASGVESGSIGGGEFILFGVRVKVDPMRKCVSMNNLSEYKPVRNTSNPMEKSGNESHIVEREADVSGAPCYVSADDVVPPPSKRSRDRKRGTPWTEEEHKQFLIGLQKVGRGDWRGISKTYVKTRTPTQVASHAQKYFNRQSNLSRRRRRSSLFDITTDSVTEVPSENRQEAPAQSVLLPASLQFSVLPLPLTAGPVLLPRQGRNHPEKSEIFLTPILNHRSTSSTQLDHHTNQRTDTDPSSLSLRLSLSTGQDHSSSSTFQVLSNLKNEDSRISVA